MIQEVEPVAPLHRGWHPAKVAAVEPDDLVYDQAKTLAGAGDRSALAALAETGHPRACHQLGALLVEEGQAQGAAFLRRAAEAGLAQAQHRYGLLCAHGAAGVPADPAAAARWCRAAADQGLPAAQYNLALLYAAGSGVPADPDQAARWLRLAAIGGVSEAEGCLDLVYRADERPRTWAEAETRASVALAHSDPQAPKTLRLAEYYVDPCLDLLINRYRFDRAAAEDIVQQFFCELEEPLAKGEHRGQAWKASLRRRYDAGRGDFRALLRRTLLNFTRDWLRRESAGQADVEAAALAEPDLASLAEAHREAWIALLARWQAAVAGAGEAAARGARALRLDLEEGLDRAVVAERLAVGERTASTALRLGAELLVDWLDREIRASPPHLQTAMREGLRLLPGWLQYPSALKRARTRLFLALIAGQGR